MRCPFCNQDNTRVVDSRPVEDSNAIRRRRMCDACGKRFTTYEKVETIPLIVIKKDQNREPYDRAKIEAGVLRACHKRPIPTEKITELVDSVETEIFNKELREISSSDGSAERSGGGGLCKIRFRLPGIQGRQYFYGRTEKDPEISGNSCPFSGHVI